jgi:hypothetical protein
MIGKNLIAAAGNGISTGEVAEAIDFDGTNDYLSRASDLTGNVNGKTFTFSAWLYNAGQVSMLLYASSTGGKIEWVLNDATNGSINLVIESPNGTAQFNLQINNAAPVNTFSHILVSCNMASTAQRWVYVNDVSWTNITWNTYSNVALDWTQTNWWVGSNQGTSQDWKGRLSNVFLDYTYRDLSNVTNRRLFVTADLKPADGQASLNPILYLPLNDPTAPGANAGTGGDFTLTGTVARSGRGPNQYNAPYSDLDGSADSLSRASDPTGLVDGNAFTLSFNVNFDTVSAPQAIVSVAGGYFVIQLTSSNVLSIVGYTSALAVVISATVSSAFVIGRNYQVVMSFDMSSTSKRHICINGQSSTVTYSTYNNANIDWTRNSFRIGGPDYVNGRLGAVWFNTSYIDLSVADNLAKFVTGTGIDAKPVDLGATGELPTGTSPLIYLPMYGNNAGKNYGTGGDFTVNSGPYTGARGPNEYWGNKTITTNGYLNRTSALSGVSDGNKFSLSFWFRPGVSGNNQALFSISTAVGISLRFFVFRTSANALRVYGRNSSGTIVFDVSTTGPSGNGFLANNNYYVQIGIDLSDTGSRSIYVNGVSMASTTTWTDYNTAGVITFSQVIQAFMAYNSFGTYTDLYNGQLSEFYFATDYINFTLEANRLKFRDAFGNPVDLTQQIEDAAIPTPAIYMRFPPTAFGTNYGTGGNFTVNGTITDGGQL